MRFSCPSLGGLFLQKMDCRMRLKALLSLFAISFIAGSTDLQAIEISGPAKVVDADTIVIGSQVIRLHGIDAPESAQRCSLSGGKSWPCGKVAIEHIKELLTDMTATCSGSVFDDYDRLLATCRNPSGVELNLDLVENGLAWAFIKYSDDYVLPEGIARGKRIGIWQHETETPWDFRAQRWFVEEQVAPDGCPIKGNISRRGQIYHTPWSRSYERTKISPERGERWFCSEAEALKAGWRAPLN